MTVGNHEEKMFDGWNGWINEWMDIWLNMLNIYGFTGVPRISPILGRTVSGSKFQWHLSHFLLDLFPLLVEVVFFSTSTSSEKRSRRRWLRCKRNLEPETVLPRTGLISEKPSAYFTTARTYVGIYIYSSLDLLYFTIWKGINSLRLLIVYFNFRVYLNMRIF